MLISEASFSPDRKYRYCLSRTWNKVLPSVAFICLNPSTADEKKNDRTVTRCINYAASWGYGTFYMLNLFAFRTKSPKIMKAENNPVGVMNNLVISQIVAGCDQVIAAWGNHGSHKHRDQQVRKMFKVLKEPLHCLKITKQKQPYHPLYLSADLTPILLP